MALGESGEPRWPPFSLRPGLETSTHRGKNGLGDRGKTAEGEPGMAKPKPWREESACQPQLTNTFLD